MGKTLATLLAALHNTNKENVLLQLVREFTNRKLLLSKIVLININCIFISLFFEICVDNSVPLCNIYRSFLHVLNVLIL